MTVIRLKRLVILTSFFFISGSAIADVKVYDKVPTVEELQRQLGGGGAPAGQIKPKTRAIVFGDAAATAQESDPAPLPIQSSANAIAFPIHFRVNSSTILRESFPFLEAVAGLMQKDASLHLIVEGHTDNSGNAAWNDALSRQRAQSVVNFLTDRYHIEPTRLTPVGKGFSEPLDGADVSDPKNRRVQFRVTG